jgi:hypothetical protein
MTVDLPPHGIERLFDLLDLVAPKQKRVSLTNWQKLIGELRSMVLGIPGGQGLFSILEEVLAHRCDSDIRLRLSHVVHDVLKDFHWLASDLAWRPTRISELIPTRQPATLGAQDAVGPGMGGVHFNPVSDVTITLLLWRSPFHLDVHSKMVSVANPKVTITNGDLELAASVATHDVLAQAADIGGSTIHHPQFI